MRTFWRSTDFLRRFPFYLGIRIFENEKVVNRRSQQLAAVGISHVGVGDDIIDMSQFFRLSFSVIFLDCLF